MSSAAPRLQLLVVGLCSESIVVDWMMTDTVKVIKAKAYAAAEDTVLGDGKTRVSLVKGVRLEQLCLVFGEPNNPTKLEDGVLLIDSLRSFLR